MTQAQSHSAEGPAFCPHCGYDLRADEPITIGDAHYDPRRGFFWRGEPVHLTTSRQIIINSLMRADGRWVSTGALAERVGYEGDNPQNLIAAQICKMRVVLRGHGIPELVGSKPGPNSTGYCWIGPAAIELARAA